MNSSTLTSFIPLLKQNNNLQKQIRAAMKQALQANTARTSYQRRKGQRRRGKLRLGRDLREDRPAHPRDCARQFPRHQSGWFMSFALLSFFPRRQSSRNLSAKRSLPLIPVTTLSGVGSRCQPAHATVRAATATKHELGLSHLNRVVSCAQQWRCGPS